MLLVCFLKVFLFVKANGTWFLKGGREDWCDTAGLTANMWRRPVSRKRAEVVGCLGFFPFEAGNPIIDGNSVGFNNFQNEIWARGLLGLMRDRKQDTDFRRLFRSLWILWNWVAFHLRSTFVQLSPSVYKLQSRSRHWCMDERTDSPGTIPAVRKGMLNSGLVSLLLSWRTTQTCHEDWSRTRYVVLNIWSELDPCTKKQISDLVYFSPFLPALLLGAEMILGK